MNNNGKNRKERKRTEKLKFKFFHPMISKKQKLHEANISVFPKFFRFPL